MADKNYFEVLNGIMQKMNGSRSLTVPPNSLRRKVTSYDT